MWLMDHQMNLKMSMEFGQYFARLPLNKSANIVNGNALRLDWEEVVSIDELSYIIGNPPFIGKSNQNAEQKSDLIKIFQGVSGTGVLDYVCGWYFKAAQFIENKKIKVAFVSTNSITQGEQVGILWNYLLRHFNINILFAHRTFSWSNEAKGNAGVHVVIIGFSELITKKKRLFIYSDVKGDSEERIVDNINPYLLNGKNNFISKRRFPICNVNEMIKGSMPNDAGNFLFSDDEKSNFINIEPDSAKYFRPFIGGYEFLNNIKRWCLWLKNAEPKNLKSLPKVLERIELVRITRLQSNRLTTQKDATTPTLFGEIRQPNTDYLALPEVSSENRIYLPIGYVKASVIASNKIYMVPNATLYSFGILHSIMHNSWIKNISGRLESRIQYSTGIVYNNYPWPESPTDKQKEAIEKAAQKVLDARAEFPNSSLADLYDPLTMPPALVKAHNELDKAVDLAYRSQPFTSDANRMEFLFELYEKYTAGLFAVEKKKKGKLIRRDK
jgi:hypothetical protein